MPRPINKFLITAGVITLTQAAGQAIFAALAIAQYYCAIDFLRHYPVLIYIRILYFHNPSRCDARVNIGASIAGVADQAFALMPREPHTTHRTFLTNCISLGFGILWAIGSVLLIKGGTLKHHSNHSHWPWLAITLPVTLLDIVAVIAYANDSFYTKTLMDIMNYVDGTVSGLGNVQLETAWAAWAMTILYSRFIIFFICNVTLMVCTVVDCTRFRSSVTSSWQCDMFRFFGFLPFFKAGCRCRRVALAHIISEVGRNQGLSLEESDSTTSSSEDPQQAIPRPGISRSFRAMKRFLFNGAAANTPASTQTSFTGGRNRQRGVNFSEEVELPATFENLIGEQQRRLNMSVVDTAGRRSPGQDSGRLAPAHSLVNMQETSTRRGAASELQRQMPWAYVPAAHRMRDQLPPDEDLPPVPLPDYTAFQSARKASVHRAASSLSSMTQKRDCSSYQSARQPPPAGAAALVPAVRCEAAPEVASDDDVSLEACDASESVYEYVSLPLRSLRPPPPLQPPPLSPQKSLSAADQPMICRTFLTYTERKVYKVIKMYSMIFVGIFVASIIYHEYTKFHMGGRSHRQHYSGNLNKFTNGQ